MKPLLEDKWSVIQYDDTPEIRDAVFERVLKFFRETKLCSGESIFQNDKGYECSPEVMADIADDIIKFKSTYKE